jgi:membrane-associated phospholipid phosphatase
VLWVVRIILLALIVMQVPAAVLEGEHWPSDGLAGLLWGGFWLLVGIQVYFWAARRWLRLVPANERREAVAHAT